MQDESIYNLIPKEYQVPEKAQRHTSKFYESVRDEDKAKKTTNKTMGPAKVQTRPPQDFLKRHEGEPKITQKEGSSFKYDTEHRKPAVPRRDEMPVHGIRTTKNFITQNAVENIMSVPKQAQKKFVDTKKGDTQNLIPSGLEPTFVHKKDFGKTPVYLENRKKEITKAQEEYDLYVQDHFKRGAMQQLSDEERREILAGLKANWEQIHHEYQGLSVVTDTAPKKNRKERMESKMKQLERDIETIEKHKIIYIAN